MMNSSTTTTIADESPPQEEHYITSISEEHETTCWGCGLRLILSPYAPIFKCGWCGAISNQNASKHDNKHFWWRCLRDRCFVCILLFFMLFIIGGGIWSIYPIIFSISYFCGVLNLSIAMILSITTNFTYILAAFRSPGAPPIIPWGSYPAVGKGGLEDYTFCHYCSKPKSPSTHHCRSCGMCVLDMDHHCPFIGNCVGASNHRSFILFLISAVTSTFYVSIISLYALSHIWPPLRYSPLGLVFMRPANRGLISRAVKEIALAFFASMGSLPIRGFILLYLFIAGVSVEIGLGVLLWQQLGYIYEGKTYLSQLSSNSSDKYGERDWQNFVRFFGCPPVTSRFLKSFRNPRKRHKK